MSRYVTQALFLRGDVMNDVHWAQPTSPEIPPGTDARWPDGRPAIVGGYELLEKDPDAHRAKYALFRGVTFCFVKVPTAPDEMGQLGDAVVYYLHPDTGEMASAAMAACRFYEPGCVDGNAPGAVKFGTTVIEELGGIRGALEERSQNT